MPSKSFAVTEAVDATIRVAVGEVEISTSTDGQVHVAVASSVEGDREAESLAEQASITLDHDKLVVELPRRVIWHGGASSVLVTLTVPEGSSVTGAAGVLTIRGTGQLGDVSVKAGIATVEVEHADAIRVKGGNGTVQARSSSEVSFSCGRGDVLLGHADDVFVKTAQGRVEIAESNGDVRVKGAMVDLDIASAESGDVAFDAAMGSARVGVAEGATVEFDLSSATGDARSDLTEVDRPSGEGPRLKVQLRTKTGDVLLHRAVRESAA